MLRKLFGKKDNRIDGIAAYMPNVIGVHDVLSRMKQGFVYGWVALEVELNVDKRNFNAEITEQVESRLPFVSVFSIIPVPFDYDLAGKSHHMSTQEVLEDYLAEREKYAKRVEKELKKLGL